MYQQQEPHLVVVVAEQVPSKTRLPSFVGFGQFALSKTRGHGRFPLHATIPNIILNLDATGVR